MYPLQDEQQRRYTHLAEEEESCNAYGIRLRQDAEIRDNEMRQEENQRLQRRQPGHIPSGGKRRKSRKVRRGRKSRKTRKSHTTRKSRKVGGRKSRKVRKSRR